LLALTKWSAILPYYYKAPFSKIRAENLLTIKAKDNRCIKTDVLVDHLKNTGLFSCFSQPKQVYWLTTSKTLDFLAALVNQSVTYRATMLGDNPVMLGDKLSLCSEITPKISSSFYGLNENLYQL
jgi:hypothetical protein